MHVAGLKGGNSSHSANQKWTNKIDEGQQQKLTQYLIHGFTYLVRKLTLYFPDRLDYLYCY